MHTLGGKSDDSSIWALVTHRADLDWVPSCFTALVLLHAFGGVNQQM